MTTMTSPPTLNYDREPALNARQRSLFDPEIVFPAIGASFKKLNPVSMLKNPVMFVTEVGRCALS